MINKDEELTDLREQVNRSYAHVHAGSDVKLKTLYDVMQQ